MKLLAVTWEDSASESVGWKQRAYVEDRHGTALCKTVGYVLKDDKKGLTLVATTADTGQVNGAICIPQSAIRKRRKLR